MHQWPILNFKKIDKILENLGFVVTRTKGSHHLYRHEDGRTTTVPNHSGRDISRPLFREFLKEINLSFDEFSKEIYK